MSQSLSRPSSHTQVKDSRRWSYHHSRHHRYSCIVEAIAVRVLPSDRHAVTGRYRSPWQYGSPSSHAPPFGMGIELQPSPSQTSSHGLPSSGQREIAHCTPLTHMSPSEHGSPSHNRSVWFHGPSPWRGLRYIVHTNYWGYRVVR